MLVPTIGQPPGKVRVGLDSHPGNQGGRVQMFVATIGQPPGKVRVGLDSHPGNQGSRVQMVQMHYDQ
jgi:hypothetical protein